MTVRDRFGEIYGREPREVPAEVLEERLAAPAALA